MVQQKEPGLRNQSPVFKFQFCFTSGVCLNRLVHLSVSFRICELRMVMPTPYRIICKENKLSKTHEME